jgi:putative ABC transport system permease protein
MRSTAPDDRRGGADSSGDDLPDSSGDDLPEALRRIVDHTIARSGLRDGFEKEVRADLEQHLREGIARGRSVEELVARFGDPATVAPILARSPAPRGAVHSHAGGGGLLGSIANDVRHVLRGLAKAPTLAVTATIVLALGVGANTVVFTVLNELLLRPIPVEQPKGLVDVWADVPGGNSFSGIGWRDYVTYAEENTTLVSLSAFSGQRLQMGEEGDAPVTAQFITPGYFEMLGLSPTLGRLAFARDASFGEPPVVVLSHAFWEEAFAADPEIVGRTIRLQDMPSTVIGVGPEGFNGHFIGFESDLWVPITAAVPLLTGFDPDDRGSKPFEMIGRLRPGVSAAGARTDLNGIAERIERTYPEFNRGHRVGVTPTTGLDHSLQGAVTAFVLILTALSGLVLLIACLNVGSVLLVRAMSRDREIAVRIALGAGNVRVLRQIVTESTILSGLGAAAGVFVAVRLNAVLAEALHTLAPGIGLNLSVDWRVLALTTAAAVVAAGVAAIAPALHVLGKDPAGVLRSRGGSGRVSARLRSMLVVGQVAVSVVLVIMTGLFARALAEGRQVDPGFDADEVVTFAVRLPVDMTSGRAQIERDLAAALEAVPDVERVARADGSPLGVARSPMFVDVPGVLPPPDEDRHVVDSRVVSAGYFETLGIELRQGRDFSREDDTGTVRVAVVSDAMANRFWPGRSPVGQTFTAGEDLVRVVGVTRDARYIVQDDTPDPLVYLSRGDPTMPLLNFTIRGPDALGSSAALGRTDAIQRAVSSLIPGHRRVQPRTSREILDNALVPQRVGALIVGAMGIMALFLAAVGLYGLIQFTVARDTHELGVRLALGGGRSDLVAVVLRKGFRLVAIGTTIGVAIALLGAPALEAFLNGVSPSDPLTYGAVVVCFALVSMLASWVPARRAMRIEASEALRGE